MSEALPEVSRLGDIGLLLRWPGGIDATTNAQVHAFAERLRVARPSWLIDLVPAYASLALLVAPEGGRDVLGDAEHWLQAELRQPATAQATGEWRPPIDIPVCYDGEFGLDLPIIAEATGLSIDQVIARHCAPTYRVAMLGFAAGFPYLLGLDPQLAMPRLSEPRLHVPAGTVGIGGAQTGIYPRRSPGGWRLLGRTPLRLFDPTRDAPSLLQAGDRVRFIAISRAQFDRDAR